MASFTRRTTSRLFSPLSMNTLAPTISPRPSRVIAPWRGAAPAARAVGVDAHERRRDVLDAAEAGIAPQDDLLAGALHVPTAGGDVVALEGVPHLLGGDGVRGEAR